MICYILDIFFDPYNLQDEDLVYLLNLFRVSRKYQLITCISQTIFLTFDEASVNLNLHIQGDLFIMENLVVAHLLRQFIQQALDLIILGSELKEMDWLSSVQIGVFRAFVGRFPSLKQRSDRHFHCIFRLRQLKAALRKR